MIILRIVLTSLYLPFGLFLLFRAWSANQFDDRISVIIDALLGIYCAAVVGTLWLLH